MKLGRKKNQELERVTLIITGKGTALEELQGVIASGPGC